MSRTALPKNSATRRRFCFVRSSCLPRVRPKSKILFSSCGWLVLSRGGKKTFFSSFWALCLRERKNGFELVFPRLVCFWWEKKCFFGINFSARWKKLSIVSDAERGGTFFFDPLWKLKYLVSKLCVLSFATNWMKKLERNSASGINSASSAHQLEVCFSPRQSSVILKVLLESFFACLQQCLECLMQKELLCPLLKAPDCYSHLRAPRHLPYLQQPNPFLTSSRPKFAVGNTPRERGKRFQSAYFAFAPDWVSWNCRNGTSPMAWLSWFRNRQRFSLSFSFSWLLINRYKPSTEAVDSIYQSLLLVSTKLLVCSWKWEESSWLSLAYLWLLALIKTRRGGESHMISIPEENETFRAREQSWQTRRCRPKRAHDSADWWAVGRRRR